MTQVFQRNQRLEADLRSSDKRVRRITNSAERERVELENAYSEALDEVTYQGNGILESNTCDQTNRAEFLLQYQRDNLTREAQERVAAQMQASDVELQSIVNASEARVGALESWANTQYGETASLYWAFAQLSNAPTCTSLAFTTDWCSTSEACI